MPNAESAVRSVRALIRAGRGAAGNVLGKMCDGRMPREASGREASRGEASRVEHLEKREFLSVSVQNGWTVVTPEGGARVIHVSSSRGSDSNSGSESSPVRSIKRAKSMMRNGVGDQVLLRRGDVWREPIGNWSVSGRSASQPAVLGAYGAGSRPRIEAVNAFYLNSRNGGIVHDVAILGIHLASPAGQDGFRVLGNVDNMLFEDVKVERYTNNFVLDRTSGRISDVKIRRSVIVDARPMGAGHAGGLFADGTTNLTLEENTFDGNGKGGGAGALSHNAYVTSDNTGFVARGNVFSNAAGHGLQARAGGIVENNFFYNNAMGMSFGVVHGDGYTRAGGVSGRISNNVISGADNAGRRTRIGIEITNVRRGGTVIENNLFVNGHPKYVADPAIALTIGSSRKNGGSAVGINDLTIRGNTVRNWARTVGISNRLRRGGSGPTALNNLTIVGNSFPTLANGGRSLRTDSGATIRVPALGTVLAARNQSRTTWNGGLTGGALASFARGGAAPRVSVGSQPTNVVPSTPPAPSTPSTGGGSSGPAVTIGDTGVLEPDWGTRGVNFTVRLSARSSKTVYVRWETKGQTARVGADYVGRNGTLVFRPGQTSKSISVAVKGDRVREANEVFVVNLLGATNARITDSQGKATIRNED